MRGRGGPMTTRPGPHDDVQTPTDLGLDCHEHGSYPALSAPATM